MDCVYGMLHSTHFDNALIGVMWKNTDPSCLGSKIIEGYILNVKKGEVWVLNFVLILAFVLTPPNDT